MTNDRICMIICSVVGAILALAFIINQSIDTLAIDMIGWGGAATIFGLFGIVCVVTVSILPLIIVEAMHYIEKEES